MGLFNKNRRDGKYIKPQGSIAVLFPFIFDRRTDAEVSSTIDFDLEALCSWVDEQNKNGNLEYKMTYFQAILACFGKVFFNRNRLNRFIQNKRLYEKRIGIRSNDNGCGRCRGTRTVAQSCSYEALHSPRLPVHLEPARLRDFLRPSEQYAQCDGRSEYLRTRTLSELDFILSEDSARPVLRHGRFLGCAP